MVQPFVYITKEKPCHIYQNLQRQVNKHVLNGQTRNHKEIYKFIVFLTVKDNNIRRWRFKPASLRKGIWYFFEIEIRLKKAILNKAGFWCD